MSQSGESVANTEVQNDDDLMCVICMESKEHKTLGLLACTHSFCSECILAWAKTENTCPLCKARFMHIDKKRISAEIKSSSSSSTSIRRSTRKRNHNDERISVSNCNQSDDRAERLEFLHHFPLYLFIRSLGIMDSSSSAANRHMLRFFFMNIISTNKH